MGGGRNYEDVTDTVREFIRRGIRIETVINQMVFDGTTTTNGSESASDAWLPMQSWLLKLRRRGIAVLLIHHAGTNGRQRARLGAKTLSISLLPCVDQTITRRSKARDLKFILKLRSRVNVDAAVRSKQNLTHLRRTKRTAFVRRTTTYVRQSSSKLPNCFKVDLRSERSPPRYGSARRRQGDYGYGR